jgi:hypothetical protein
LATNYGEQYAEGRFASRGGFRRFTAAQDFKDYVEKEILVSAGQGVGAN